MKQWSFKIVNVAGQIPEILIYGLIGDFGEAGNVTFNDFQAQFRQLEGSNTECIVRINSDGGSVLEGLAIYDLMDKSKMKIITIVDGTAASMAAILAQAGKVRLIATNGYFMIHRAQGSVTGDAQTIKTYGDQVAELNNRIQSILIKKTGLSPDLIDSLMPAGQNTFINAQDAINKYHLADALLESMDYFGEYTMTPNITNMNNNQRANWTFMDWFKNDPNGLTALQTTNPGAWNKLYKDLEISNKAPGSRPNGQYTTPSNQTIINPLQNNNSRSDWGYMDWLKNDPEGLNTMKAANPDVWNKLYNDLERSNVGKGYSKPNVSTIQSHAVEERSGLPAGMHPPTNLASWTYWDYAKNDPKALAAMQQNEPQKFNNLVKAVAGQAKAKGWI